MSMKIVGACGLAVLAWTASAVDYPVYVIETDAGSLAAPVALDGMDVTRFASAGAAGEVVSFASLGRPATGTFLKRGDGYVMSSTQLTNFTGTIVVEEGVLCLDRPGQTGPAKNTAGTLVVSNGATLAIVPASGTCANYGMQVWCKVLAEGDGVDGMGAIYNGSNGVTVRETFKGGFELTGDLVFGGNGTGQLGDVAGHPYKLNGHTLITKGSGGLLVNGGEFEAGNVVITNGSRIQFQSGLTFQGGAENVLKITSGSYYTFYNAITVKSSWTLDLDDGAILSPSGGNANEWQRKDRHNWGGPVITRGIATLNGDSAGARADVFTGCVSGAGGFNVVRGWLNLYADNTFEGPLWASACTKTCLCGIGLHSAHAWPAGNDHVLALTNACLWINSGVQTYLPAVDLKADVGYATNMVIFGTSSALIPRLRKSGAASATIETPVVVTGRTELAEGTLRVASPAVYSDQPGLWESRYVNEHSWSTAELNTYYKDGTVAPTNRVTSYPLLAEVINTATTTKGGGENMWGTNDFARYEGYIWNREPTNALYGFALAFCAKGKLLIDDQLVLEGQGNWYYLRTNTVDLAPGPHKFDLRLYTTTYSSSGARYGAQGVDFRFYEEQTKDPNDTAGKKYLTDVDWTEAGKGFVWRLGAATPKCQDYEVPANAEMPGGGNGQVFTRDTESVLRSSAVFSNLVCRTGTVLDLCGLAAPLVVPNLEGFTAVSNGSLTVADSWTVGASGVNDGTKLTVDGTLTFSAGATFALDDLELYRRRGTYAVVAEADEIVGTPALSPALAEAGALFMKTSEGRALALFVPRKGMMFFVR